MVPEAPIMNAYRISLPHGVILAVLSLGLLSPAGADDKKAADVKPSGVPRVEVVFCLDTTGSMGGLIDGAKAKIWSICNQIAAGKPSPELKVGLVAYRDRGDAYVTKVFDLSDDLDQVHSHLKEFRAQGGGDTPESVNQALDDAVNKIHWSKGDDVLRIIFLVGDAPPKMTYPDDVKYPVTCEKACRMGIIINTIQCGGMAECTRHWQEIARKAEGQYVQIAQTGGVVAIATPHDKRLAEINTELAKSTVVYGEAKDQERSRKLAAEAGALPAPAAADRAAFNAQKAQNAAYDLLDAVKQNKVKLDEIKKEHLPPEMQKMTLEEQKAHLAKLETRRAELQKEALELNRQRTEFINQRLAETKGRDGFDQQVLDVLRQQARRVKVDY
jgi:Mg-chelatase subunit ChlD